MAAGVCVAMRLVFNHRCQRVHEREGISLITGEIVASEELASQRHARRGQRGSTVR